MADDIDLAVLTDEQLEIEVRALSARVAAATCQFLLAVAEYDRREAYQAWDCHDMAGWLMWKCGICSATARQYVTVARALVEFDAIRDRFAAGRLSYSQVRAICRVVDPDTEHYLLELAEVSTAAQLEKITRAYRRCSTPAADTEERRHAHRYLRYHQDDHGNLVGTFQLPPDTGALVMAAIEAAVGDSDLAEADADGTRDPYSAVRADALVELVTTAATTPPDADSQPPFLVNVIVEPPALTTGDTSGPVVCQIVDGPGLADETARRIACDAATVHITESPAGDVLDVGRRTRRIHRRLRRALQLRDGGCRFPGCTRPGVQAHHLIHWADGGPTNLDNLISLCWRHHRRVHETGYQIHQHAHGRIDFTHPDGRILETIVAPIPPNQAASNWPEPVPYHNHWDGTRLDLNTIVEGLLCPQPTNHHSGPLPDAWPHIAAT
ncbi:MAG TPA: DUF222 domain-containing protein [Acidimicrobiales bacterium]|jgi:hypothetical protein|nr:DUF222 domain-containing protein [Acidimicrobiales bacterium]